MRSKNFLISLSVVAAIALWLNWDGIETKARYAIADAAGNAVVSTLTRAVAGNNDRGLAAAELITLPITSEEVSPGIFRASGVGNSYVLTTSEGNVVFDTGLIIQASEQIDQLQALTGDAEPISIILSHSHADHVGGTRLWDQGQTQIITHEAFEEEQRYLTELNPYLHRRNRVLFPWLPETPSTLPGLNFRGLTPDVRVDNDRPYRFTLGNRRFEVHATPGAEGADNLVLWLPDEKILLSGDFFGPQFPQFPNLFTMRGEKMRKPVEYIASLNHLLALKPAVILPNHLDGVWGKDKIRDSMVRIRDAVQFVHDETFSGMNAGKTVEQLMKEIRLPAHLELSQTHGKVSWAVRSIWEYYATWFHFERTSELYATPLTAIQEDLISVVNMPAAMQLVRRYLTNSEPEKALLLLELLGDEPNSDVARAARLETLAQLERRAQAHANDYELYWLASELDKARAAPLRTAPHDSSKRDVQVD